MDAAQTAAPSLTCDEDHRYRIGQERLPGVSEILKDNGLVDDRWFTESARSRGAAVHAELAEAARGFPEFPFLDPDLLGWCRSGRRFIKGLQAEGHRILAVEKMRWHPLYRFAGCPDLVTRAREYDFVWDFKTGRAMPATRYQLAAYDLLLGPTQDGKPRKKAAVELREDGGIARIVDYSSIDHFHDGATFLALLTATRTRQLYGHKNA